MISFSCILLFLGQIPDYNAPVILPHDATIGMCIWFLFDAFLMIPSKCIFFGEQYTTHMILLKIFVIAHQPPFELRRLFAHSDLPLAEDFCNRIHKTLLKNFRYALVWGSSGNCLRVFNSFIDSSKQDDIYIYIYIHFDFFNLVI